MASSREGCPLKVLWGVARQERISKCTDIYNFFIKDICGNMLIYYFFALHKVLHMQKKHLRAAHTGLQNTG